MKEYIILLSTKINGKWTAGYHEKITETPKISGVMNIYTEHVTIHRKKAKVFYKKSEAEAVLNMFICDAQTGEVIEK